MHCIDFSVLHFGFKIVRRCSRATTNDYSLSMNESSTLLSTQFTVLPNKCQKRGDNNIYTSSEAWVTSSNFLALLNQRSKNPRYFYYTDRTDGSSKLWHLRCWNQQISLFFLFCLINDLHAESIITIIANFCFANWLISALIFFFFLHCYIAFHLSVM